VAPDGPSQSSKRVDHSVGIGSFTVEIKQLFAGTLIAEQGAASIACRLTVPQVPAANITNGGVGAMVK
jgi:hypothetical protein